MGSAAQSQNRNSRREDRIPDSRFHGALSLLAEAFRLANADLITSRKAGCMKAKRIVVYGRVSTDAQSHASQLREVRAYVRRRWPKAEVIEYLDKTSGARFTREGLDTLMAEVRKGRIDVVAVYK